MPVKLIVFFTPLTTGNCLVMIFFPVASNNSTVAIPVSGD